MNTKICVVTGAGSGIGRATAIKLADAGFFPVLVGRTTSKLLAVSKEINDRGFESAVEQADVTNYDAVRSMATSIISGGHLTFALRQFNLTEKVNHISTAGGALVRYLTGQKLPMIKCLEDAAERHAKD